jgi:hypothetical protein
MPITKILVVGIFIIEKLNSMCIVHIEDFEALQSNYALG